MVPVECNSECSKLFGNLTVKLDNTGNSINIVTAGTGDDTVTIDGISVFNLNSGDGNDQFFLPQIQMDTTPMLQ